jgi:hypothetical protein
MTATIAEMITGPVVTVDEDKATLELAYSILDAADAEAALTLLISTAPATRTVNSIVLAKRVFRLEPEGTIFRGSVEYSRVGATQQQQEPIPEGQSTFQFETGGGNTTITHSIATVQRYKRGGGTPIDFKNAIGFDGERINGVDIVTPVYTFSETHALANSVVDSAYRLALFRATGKTNNATFKGFDAGEVLFLGASGSRRPDGIWDITYRFAASENLTDLDIGGITGVAKKGWEYLWLYFEDAESEDVLVKQPEQVFIEQVYQSHDFANIGIGT